MSDTSVPVRRRYRRADAERRAEVAHRERISGATWDAAALAAGLSSGAVAQRAVKRWLEAMPVMPLEDMRRDSATVLTMARIKALEHMDAGRAGSIADVVRVEQTIASLYGLNAPTQITVHNPTATEMEQWIAAMVQSAMPSLVEADVIDVDSDEVGVGIQIVEDGIGVLDVLGADRDGDDYIEVGSDEVILELGVVLEEPTLEDDFSAGGGLPG